MQKVGDILQDQLFLSDKDKKSIQSKSLTQFLELLFSSEIKNYTMECTKLNEFLFSLDELDAFIGIIIFSSYNNRLYLEEIIEVNIFYIPFLLR